MAEADPMKFMMELVEKISNPAKAAEKALGKLGVQLKAEEKQLARLQKQMQVMQQQDKVSLTSYRNLSQRIADKTEKIGGLKEEMGGLEQVVASGNTGLSGMLETLGPLAAVAAGAAVGFELLKKGLDLLAEGEKIAIEASEAKNETVEMLNALLGGEEAARSTYAAIEGIQNDVALSHTRLLDLTRQLTASGITNKNALIEAVRTIGQAESVLGEGAGGKLQGIIERASQTGVFKLDPRKLIGTGVTTKALYEELARETGKGIKTVEAQLKAGRIKADVGISALTRVVNDKFGELAKGKTQTFTAQIQRAQDNILKLFQDVDTSKLLAGLNEILSVFDQSTTSGAALHETITMIFDGVSDAIAAVEPYVKTFFKGLLIIGLDVYIGLKPLFYQLGILGKDTDGPQKLARVMSVIGDVAGGAASQISRIAYEIGVLTKLVGFISTTLPAEFIKLGHDIVTGFADGITAGIGNAIAAVSNMGKSTVAAFKKIWKIGSPSKVAEDEIAGNIVLGYVRGIDKHIGPANDATNRFARVTAGTAGSGTPPSASSARASGSGMTVQVTIQPGAIQINGVPNAETLLLTLPNVFGDIFEQALKSRVG